MMSEGTGTEVLRPPEKKARLGDPGGGFDGAAVPVARIPNGDAFSATHRGATDVAAKPDVDAVVAVAPVSRSPTEASVGSLGQPPPRKRERDAGGSGSGPSGARPPAAAKAKAREPLPYTDLVTVGKGTYGEVYKAKPGPARRAAQGEIVALKMLIQRHDDWGFPITSLREHRILLRLRHPNLVKLHEIYTPTPSYESHVYMVFEYLELDLEILIQSPVVKAIEEARVKSILNQLLDGVHFMHANQVMHRDLKPSNLLVNRRGDVKVCDFGLARSYKPGHAYTGTVITLNYRPPELCLGCRHYGPAIDVWSVGAIFAELLGREIAIPGREEHEYLQNIYAVCGTPAEADWPEAKRVCPRWKEACAPPRPPPKDRDPQAPAPVRPHKPYQRALGDKYAPLSPLGAPLLDRLLALSPKRRVSAKDALDDDYFWEGDPPLPPDARALPWDVDSVRAARDDQLRSRKHAHF